MWLDVVRCGYELVILYVYYAGCNPVANKDVNPSRKFADPQTIPNPWNSSSKATFFCVVFGWDTLISNPCGVSPVTPFQFSFARLDEWLTMVAMGSA